MTVRFLKSELAALAQPSRAHQAQYFFKTQPGQYSSHDQFLGIPVPTLRTISKKYTHLSESDISELLHSHFNEERLLALFILVHQFKQNQKATYDFYLKHLKHVNNWNLVDSSAHLIIGAYLFNNPSPILEQFAVSQDLWERRIAIVATWYFIKKDSFENTIHIATILLQDKHDLIHKATGWMLREMGKRNKQKLIDFLDAHSSIMPRTMLRYALEKLTPEEKALYMKQKKGSQI
jgi:3-methyladenine DNA glycosylase AlkD